MGPSVGFVVFHMEEQVHKGPRIKGPMLEAHSSKLRVQFQGWGCVIEAGFGSGFIVPLK